jgi:hypothetical protein
VKKGRGLLDEGQTDDRLRAHTVRKRDRCNVIDRWHEKANSLHSSMKDEIVFGKEEIILLK